MSKDTLQRRPSNKKLLALGLLLLVQLTASVVSFLNAKNNSVPLKKRIVPPISNTMMLGFDAQHTNFNPAEHTINLKNVSHLVPYWIVSIPPHRFSNIYPPAVVNGVVYFTSGDSTVSAYDAKTGHELWISRIGGSGYALAVANGRVYVSSDDEHLYVFNAGTGTLLWRVADVSGVPVVANSIIYIFASSGELYGLDTKSGAKLWITTIGTSPQSDAVAVADGIVYDSIDTALRAFDASTGNALWSSIIEGAGFLSIPAVANGIVYVGSDFPDGKLYAFDAKTGRTLWTYRTVNDRYSVVNVGAVAGGVVYVTAGVQTVYLYALDMKTGASLWTFRSPPDTITSVPFVANGVLYIDIGGIYAYNAKTGSPLWSYSGIPGDSYVSDPLVVDGVVYIGSYVPRSSYQNKLYTLHLPSAT